MSYLRTNEYVEQERSYQAQKGWHLCQKCAKKHYIFFGDNEGTHNNKCDDCGKETIVITVRRYFDFIEKHNRDLECR